jgi:hypothetical protein
MSRITRACSEIVKMRFGNYWESGCQAHLIEQSGKRTDQWLRGFVIYFEL